MPADTPETPVRHFEEVFPSGTKRLPVERFVPEGDGPFPSLVLLHGADGVRARIKLYREVAGRFASAGYGVLLPHYFGDSETAFSALRMNPLDFLGWVRAVADVVDHANGLPHANAGKVGLIGFSLGAYLSLAVASQDSRVGAVVECFGGLPQLLAPAAATLPPVLILHGARDPIIPVSQAYDLERTLKGLGKPYEMHIYPDQGHGFEGPALDDALRRALDFLGKHL